MRRASTVLATVLLVAAAGGGAAQAAGRCGSHPWCDTALSPDARAELLLAALTRDEKISLLAGDDPFGVTGAEGTHTGTSNGVAAGGPADDLLQRRPGRRALGPGHADARADPAGLDLRPLARLPARSHDRQRGEEQGQRRRLRPHREPHAHPARRAQLRVLRRGPVPDDADGRGVDPGRPVRGSDRQRQALRRQQPGGRAAGHARRREPGQPADRERRDRRADAPRDVPAALRGGDQGGQRRLGHVLLQPRQRAVRVRERAPARGRAQGRLGLRAASCWPTTARRTTRRRRSTTGSTSSPGPGWRTRPPRSTPRSPRAWRPSPRSTSTSGGSCARCSRTGSSTATPTPTTTT